MPSCLLAFSVSYCVPQMSRTGEQAEVRVILTQVSASEGYGKRRQPLWVRAIEVHVRMLNEESDQLDVPLCNRLPNEPTARMMM